MKALITGSTGFIGSHLTELLLQEGCEVRALVRESSDVSLLKSLDVEIVYGDILDIDSLEKAVSGCEIVYHLAARTSHQASWLKQEDYAVNVEGVRNLADASLRAKVGRFVYGSSAGVYGFIKDSAVDEKTKPNPNNHYRKSKLLGENLVRSLHKKEGLPVVIARISSVYGPRSLNWLGLFQSIATKRFRMIGSGENHVHLGYVSDIVDGLRGCADKADIEGECYIISGKETIKLKQFVDMIAEELGISISSARSPKFPFRVYNDIAAFIYRRSGLELPRVDTYELFLEDSVLSNSKAEKELGYDPKVSVKEGIQRTVKWYRENGFL